MGMDKYRTYYLLYMYHLNLKGFVQRGDGDSEPERKCQCGVYWKKVVTLFGFGHVFGESDLEMEM